MLSLEADVVLRPEAAQHLQRLVRTRSARRRVHAATRELVWVLAPHADSEHQPPLRELRQLRRLQRHRHHVPQRQQVHGRLQLDPLRHRRDGRQRDQGVVSGAVKGDVIGHGQGVQPRRLCPPRRVQGHRPGHPLAIVPAADHRWRRFGIGIGPPFACRGARQASSAPFHTKARKPVGRYRDSHRERGARGRLPSHDRDACHASPQARPRPARSPPRRHPLRHPRPPAAATARAGASSW